MTEIPREIIEASKHFCGAGRVLCAGRLHGGHINGTYVVTHLCTDGVARKRVMQRINTAVFARPLELMENVLRVSEHIRMKSGADARGAIRFLRTLDGAPALDGAALGFWRAYEYIGGADGFDAPRNDGDARNAGAAFGRFQAQLADLPAPRLHETIPNFHDTRRRFAALEKAAADDAAGRRQGCAREIARLLELRPAALKIQEAAEAGVIRERITHNDAKFSNLLLDAADGRPVCVIDLDTCMPGLPHHDFGDLVRSVCSSEPEDSAAPERTFVKLGAWRALREGYEGEAFAFLSADETALLPDASVAATLELAARFLADHLDGDKYFAVRRPLHNLIRARAQLAYGEKLLKALPLMRAP